MKIRNGFVSNSSTSSFVAVGCLLDDSLVTSLFNLFDLDIDDCSIYEVCVLLEDEDIECFVLNNESRDMEDQLGIGLSRTKNYGYDICDFNFEKLKEDIEKSQVDFNSFLEKNKIKKVKFGPLKFIIGKENC